MTAEQVTLGLIKPPHINSVTAVEPGLALQGAPLGHRCPLRCWPGFPDQNHFLSTIIPLGDSWVVIQYQEGPVWTPRRWWCHKQFICRNQILGNGSVMWFTQEIHSPNCSVLGGISDRRAVGERSWPLLLLWSEECLLVTLELWAASLQPHWLEY